MMPDSQSGIVLRNMRRDHPSADGLTAAYGGEDRNRKAIGYELPK
jgi:hypothetical protein